MENKKAVVKNISLLIQAAQELVDRIDHPEKIPDTCYRGDVSRWNFGYFLSRREKLGGEALATSGVITIAELIGLVCGENSEQVAVYNRAVDICRSYSAVYNLEIKNM